MTLRHAAALMVALILPPAASAETVLRYSDHQPLDGMRTTFLSEVFFPAIERESQGRLRIEAHWNGEIAAPYDALAAVSQGADADMATTVPEYTATELPLHQLFKSFLTGPSGDAQVDLFRRIYQEIPEFTEELDRNNLVPVFLGTGYPVAFFSSRPMASLADLEGGTWRSASFWHLRFLENAGAQPVRIHWGQAVYDALQNGTLDGLMVNVDSGNDLKVYDHAPHVLLSQSLWLGHLYPVVMNKSTWAALPEQDQQAIARAAAFSYQQLGQVMEQAFADEIQDLTAKGAHLRRLTLAEVDAFAASTKYAQVQDDWARTQEAETGLPMRGVLERMRAIIHDAAQHPVPSQ
ncbi:MAG: TRAP transporter substrate-binding protein DctP [Pseudomonadota bacterium]|nr:TRAP transporter substrate-binding protein DctP [Pseudomonadota bacterium]